jgi:LysM domain
MNRSHPSLRRIRSCPWAWFLLLALAADPFLTAHGGSLVYKNYVVRYDRGWDILCEPYVVQKDDWVLKIFRQKGEIAHQDFREFLGIFERLNPHVKNIDMIRPGQAIDIPLRKLEHGALAGQATGVVTIPFVTLSPVSDIIKEHSQSYQIRRGDTVSKLLAAKYGRYGSRSYQEGVKLFQSANPQVTDLNRIYAGQRIYLPDPAIREKSFYNAMYDEKGNLREKVPRSISGAKGPTAAAPPAAAGGVPVPAKVAAAPVEAPKPAGALAEAAALVGGQLHDRGTYYLPRAGQQDFELDLSRNPELEFSNGTKIVFSPGDRVMDMDKDQFQATWPDIKTVTADDQSSTQQIVASIFETLGQNGASSAEVSFEAPGVHVAVRSKWVKPESEGRHLCITPIAGPEQQTPESIRRFLDQNGVVLKEILPGGAGAEVQNESQLHAVQNVLALAPTNQKDFVQNLARTLEFSYTANTPITFPYAGIQVQAYADLLSAGNGKETLVDFGDLYGDAVKAIRQTGLNLVQITADDSYDAIAQKLLGALGIAYESQPVFLAARRPAQYNTAITVSGILYAKSEKQHILLTGAPLPSAVTDMLSRQGIDVVMW